MSHTKNKRVPRRASAASSAKPLSRRKIWLFRLALLLVPFLLLALLEAGLRLGGYGFDPHFFKRLNIGGKAYLVENDSFSYRFFPKNNARNPGALRMPLVKPPGTVRIFIFGESAAMGDPEPAYGPARYMLRQLQAKFPDTKFEVVNTAFTAINSHGILPIARECAHQHGDIWIIYMGNNEMVGPYGAASVFGRRSPPLPLVRFLTAVQTTRIGQLCVNLARRLHRHGEKFPAWGGMAMFMHNQIPPGSPLKDNVYHSFRINLDDMVRAGLNSGAKVMLNTVAVNLRDCPPFASLHSVKLSPAALNQFNQFYTNGLQDQARHDLADAETNYAAAAQLDSKYAALQYQWGKCLLRQTNLIAAHRHLQLACDDDALPFRTDSKLNGMIRAEAKKRHGKDLYFFDAAAALASSNADDLCGDETFYEHVHFNFTGAYRLGLAWARQVENMLPKQPAVHKGWLTSTQCARRLGLSDWNRVAVWQSMIARLRVPPFTGQPGNAQRIAALQNQIARLRPEMNTNTAAVARRNFQKQIARWPNDFQLLGNDAIFLQSIGDLPGALAQWQRVRKLIPQDYVSMFQLGHVLNIMGRLPQAEQDLRAAVTMHHSFPEAWAELGDVLAAQKKYRAALTVYATARRQSPDDAETLFHMGLVHDQLQQPAAALACYREAARLDPGNWEIHFELGGALNAAHQLDAALAEFAQAVKLNPGNAQAHFNHGVLLAKLNHLDAARQEFMEALRLNPRYQNAQAALEKVQMLLQQPAQK